VRKEERSFVVVPRLRHSHCTRSLSHHRIKNAEHQLQTRDDVHERTEGEGCSSIRAFVSRLAHGLLVLSCLVHMLSIDSSVRSREQCIEAAGAAATTQQKDPRMQCVFPLDERICAQGGAMRCPPNPPDALSRTPTLVHKWRTPLSKLDSMNHKLGPH